MVACHEHTVYHSFDAIPHSGWNREDTLSFEITLNDSVLPATFTAIAEIRNENNYPYRDLYLRISHNLQDSTVWETDTLHVCLTDERGNWRGKGWGGIYVSEFPLPKTCVISATGKRSVKVTHCMNDTLLQGIHDIGIRLQRTTPENEDVSK